MEYIIIGAVAATIGFIVGFLGEYLGADAKLGRAMNEAIAVETYTDDEDNVSKVSFIFDENLNRKYDD